MLDVCNRKVPKNVTVKDAHKIYKHLFHEYGQGALLAEPNEGVGSKAMMHATRICREAEELLLTHTITDPRPEAGLLLRMRKGELPYRQVADSSRPVWNGWRSAAAIDASRGTRPDFRRGPGGRAAPQAGRRLNIATASSRRP